MTPFIVATDASNHANGGFLSQVQDGQERVISILEPEIAKAYSTIECEGLAVAAVKNFYPYLYGFHFKLVTDHNPLTSLKGLKDTGGYLAHWLIYLQQFDYLWIKGWSEKLKC